MTDDKKHMVASNLAPRIRKKAKQIIHEIDDEVGVLINPKTNEFFKLQEIKVKSGGIVKAYVPIDKEEYHQELRAIAERIAGSFRDPESALADIIEDALEEEPWKDVQRIGEVMGKEIDRAKAAGEEPKVATKKPRGSCIDVQIGDEMSLRRRRKNGSGDGVPSAFFKIR